MTGFIALHDFRKGQPFDQEYELFVEKYNRRFGRLFELLQQASSILFVRTNVQKADYEKLLALEQLNPDAQMDFLIINTMETDQVKRLESPYNNMMIYGISEHPDIAYDVWMGNHAHWREVLSGYSLKNYKDWLTDGIKSVIGDRQLVLWGFGGAGKKIAAQIKAAKDPVSIGWFVDSNSAKWGMADETTEVRDTLSLMANRDDVLVLICVYGDTEGIEDSLAKMQFPESAAWKIVYEGLTPVGLEKCVYSV